MFVLDTGIRISHSDFGGRARWGHNFIQGSSNNDIHGHGTHVAGTIAGRLFGVAKLATVVAVKVLGDQNLGPLAGIIAGIQWAVRNAPQGGRSGMSLPKIRYSAIYLPCSAHADLCLYTVINMSLGGLFSRAHNDAAENAVRAGVTLITSAGNQGRDANLYSPASAALVITVGSIDRNHNRASDSNFGPAVNIFAPGVGIVSCGVRNDNDWREMSGTSMAAPHVAGVAASLIRLENLSGPSAVRGRILQLATRGLVRNPAGSPNLFLHNGSNIQ